MDAEVNKPEAETPEPTSGGDENQAEKKAGVADEAEEAGATAAEESAVAQNETEEQRSPAEQAPAEQAPAEQAPAEQAAAQQVAPVLQGELRRGRAGLVQLLLWCTGLALLAWLARGVLALLGLRHPAELSLTRRSISIRGQRKFMGLQLGETRDDLPLGAVQGLSLRAQSGLWVVVAAVCALAVAAAVGVTLVSWGLSGEQPGWIVLGLLVVGAGIGLDALAYLWVRAAQRRGLAVLELRAPGRRLRLCCVNLTQARAVLDRVGRE